MIQHANGTGFRSLWVGMMAGLLLVLNTLVGHADEPTRAPKELARQWRLVCWYGNEFSGIGLSVIPIEIDDGKVKLGTVPADLKKWGRSISDLEYANGVLRFKVTYDTSVDVTTDQPLREEWFEGRFDPAFPNRVWGVLGPKDPADDETAFRHEMLRPAELSPAPAEPEILTFRDAKTGEERIVEDGRWSMPSATSPGLGTVVLELQDARNELAASKERDSSKLPGSAYFATLEELAASRKPNRRGYYMLRLLVENAHLASIAPERVSGWLGEILAYTAPYGPRYEKLLRARLADQLEEGKEEEYKPLIEKLRSSEAFTPTDLTKK